MYSMVLMMAMSTSPDTVACHKVMGCSGCTGCSGAVASCCGCHGFLGGLFKKHHGCNGCNGCSGCSGTPAPDCASCPTVEATPAPAPAPAPEEKKEMPKDKKGGVTKNTRIAPALITVNVPADAKLSIDGVATLSSSNVRMFQTASLKSGTVHYFTFSAEVVRNGLAYTATEKVAVEAGANAVISLNPNVGPAVANK